MEADHSLLCSSLLNYYPLFQFFAHPVINSLMSQKWYGELGRMRKSSWLTMERWAWGFLNVWCLFDVILFPVIFFVLGAYHFARKKFRNRKGDLSVILSQQYL